MDTVFDFNFPAYGNLGDCKKILTFKLWALAPGAFLSAYLLKIGLYALFRVYRQTFLLLFQTAISGFSFVVLPLRCFAAFALGSEYAAAPISFSFRSFAYLLNRFLCKRGKCILWSISAQTPFRNPRRFLSPSITSPFARCRNRSHLHQ